MCACFFKLLSFKHFAEQCKKFCGVKNLGYVILTYEILINDEVL